jgi:hypothetical protein
MSDWREILKICSERAVIEKSILSQALSDLAGERFSAIFNTQDVFLSEVFQKDDVDELARFGIYKLDELILSLRFFRFYDGKLQFFITPTNDTFCETTHWINEKVQNVLTELKLGFLFDDLLAAILLRNTEDGMRSLIPLI